MDPLQHVKKKKNEETRREGQASDQNKITSMLFFPPLSSSEQGRNVDLDVREGTNCGNLSRNEKESLQTTS